jgi:hypothetical protein
MIDATDSVVGICTQVYEYITEQPVFYRMYLPLEFWVRGMPLHRSEYYKIGMRDSVFSSLGWGHGKRGLHGQARGLGGAGMTQGDRTLQGR